MTDQQISAQLTDRLYFGNGYSGVQHHDLPEPVGPATGIGYIDRATVYLDVPPHGAKWVAARHDGWTIGLTDADGAFLISEFVENTPDRQRATDILTAQITTLRESIATEAARRARLAEFAGRVAALPLAADRARAAARCCDLGGSTPDEIAPMIGVTARAIADAMDDRRTATLQQEVQDELDAQWSHVGLPASNR